LNANSRPVGLYTTERQNTVLQQICQLIIHFKNKKEKLNVAEYFARSYLA